MMKSCTSFCQVAVSTDGPCASEWGRAYGYYAGRRDGGSAIIAFSAVAPTAARDGSNRGPSNAAPDVADREPLGERILGVDHVVGESRNPRPAANGRNYGAVGADLGFADQPASKCRPENTFVDEVLSERELALGVQD